MVEQLHKTCTDLYNLSINRGTRAEGYHFVVHAPEEPVRFCSHIVVTLSNALTRMRDDASFANVEPTELAECETVLTQAIETARGIRAQARQINPNQPWPMQPPRSRSWHF